jgi:hypothetical protein
MTTRSQQVGGAGVFTFVPSKRRRGAQEEEEERENLGAGAQLGGWAAGGAAGGAKGRKAGLSPCERTALLLQQGAKREARLATEAASDAEGMTDAASGTGACHVCQRAQPRTAGCAHCAKGVCGTCTHRCDGCAEEFCHFCSTCDYGARFERWFCLECSERLQSHVPMEL